MNLSEFRAWFDGFAENLDGPPNDRQWARIQAKIKTLASEPTSRTVFIERYAQPYQTWLSGPYRYHTASDSGSLPGINLAPKAVAANAPVTAAIAALDRPWNAESAFRALGRCEAED